MEHETFVSRNDVVWGVRGLASAVHAVWGDRGLACYGFASLLALAPLFAFAA